MKIGYILINSQNWESVIFVADRHSNNDDRRRLPLDRHVCMLPYHFLNHVQHECEKCVAEFVENFHRKVICISISSDHKYYIQN